MPKQTDIEMRKTLLRATEILHAVSERHNVDIRSMRDCAARSSHFVAARREFCILAHAAGAGARTIAKILECTPGTVRYHLKPNLRAHRRIYYRNRRHEMRMAA